jgi:spermidine synthase
MASGQRTLGYGVMALAIGGGVMAIEITASRMLAPHFGTSMIVWTSLILSVLTALSFGYWIGGNVAARGAAESSIGTLLAASAATVICGTWVVRSFAASLADLLHGVGSATATAFVGSFAVALFVFALPVFLLAIASPMVVKLWTSADHDAGRAAGRYFAVSTFGSMAGTVAPTLLLVPIWGSRATLLATAAFLGVAGLVALHGRKRLVVLLGLAGLFLATAVMPVSAEPGVIEERESQHQLIRVLDEGDGVRSMTFNEGLGVQSITIPADGTTGYYYDHFAALPALLGDRADDHDALLLGLAGGTAAWQYLALRADDHRIRFTGVEIDEAVIDLARRHFALDALPISVVHDDARAFLSRSDDRYDTVMIDAYAVQLYIPSHLVTEEFFALVRSRLRDGGIVAMNVNASERDAPLLAGILNTLGRSFPYVASIEVDPGFWNYMVLASDRPLAVAGAAASLEGTVFTEVADAWRTRAVDAPPYDPARLTFTDDAAPVEFLTENMVLSSLRR